MPQLKQAQSLADHVDQICDSSVMVESYHNDGNGDIGAGFFIAPRVVLTCAHVLGLSPQNTTPDLKAVLVATTKNQKYYCKILDFDVQLDVVILYVHASEEIKIPYLNLGNSGTIREAEGILTVGSPLGYKNSVSYGIISNNNLSNPNYFLMDVRTNPGNSGGLVYSLDKQAVIGIAVAIISPKNIVAEGLSVGIAIDPVKEMLKRNRIKFVYNEQDSE